MLSALITGPARGIGEALARELAARGARLALVGMEPERLEALARDLGAGHVWFACDVTDQQALVKAVEEIVRELGGLDVVVANAGIASNGTVAITPMEALARVVDVNLTGVIRTVHATLPHVTARRGYYLLVSSAAAIAAAPGLAAYSATKSGVEQFGNALRLELQHKGVAVGVAHPSWIDTDLVRDTRTDLATFEHTLRKLPGPFGVVTSAGECARLLADGIERRSRKIYIPRSLGIFAAIRHLFTTKFFGRMMVRHAHIEAREAEVLKLGRVFGEHSVERGYNVPTHPTMTVDPGRPVVLFIHGFGSTAKCWSKLLALLRADERITSRYDLHTWEYPTSWFEANFMSRIPDINEIGESLADVLASPDYRDREVTLVGHSQGGLVIQSCFAGLVSTTKAAQLSHIRQAILMATPSRGSTTAMSLRLLASSLIHNPQEIKLRVLHPDVAKMTEQVQAQVCDARKDTDSTHRVAMHAFCGLSDNIVQAASASGSFSSVFEVPGTHFSIITPRDRDDDRYKRFAERLLDPGGHRQRYEIEHYRTELRVEPREQQVFRTKAKNPYDVVYDNYATLKRTVRFAHANKCDAAFTIKYGTQGQGCIVPWCSHENEAAPSVIEQWNLNNKFYQFDFTPKPGEDFCLGIDIYKGFDEGQRDVHFHLLDHSYYRRLTYVLDLTAYVAAGYQVTVGPSFYVDPNDAGCSEICGRRKLRDPLPPTRQPAPGRYEWELSNLRGAVVDMVWDVARR